MLKIISIYAFTISDSIFVRNIVFPLLSLPLKCNDFERCRMIASTPLTISIGVQTVVSERRLLMQYRRCFFFPIFLRRSGVRARILLWKVRGLAVYYIWPRIHTETRPHISFDAQICVWSRTRAQAKALARSAFNPSFAHPINNNHAAAAAAASQSCSSDPH